MLAQGFSNQLRDDEVADDQGEFVVVFETDDVRYDEAYRDALGQSLSELRF